MATVTAERKPWHGLFRLLERDERVFAVLLAVAMVGGLATLGLVPLQPRQRIDLLSLVVWFAFYKLGIFALVTVQPRATRAIFLGALAIDLLLVFVLVLLTGGGGSLFYLLFFPLVAVNAYYFGPWIAFAAALIAGGLMAAAASLAPPWIGWTGVTLLVVLFGLPAVTVGIVADRERRARGEVEGLLSRLQAAQQELVVAERMATVGRLSLKVAHEVRNPISAIELNAEMLEDIVRARSGVDMEEAGGLVASIRDQVNTLDALTEEYLAFARFPKSHFEEESINHLVEELAAFVRPVAHRQGVTMHVETDPLVPMMEIDRALLRQAILNLVKNGQEALSRGGSLTISSRATGDAVEIAIADTGPGIAPEVAHRVFEQFFTTKPQGTGLGLSISRQIIEEHGGELTWANRPGGGAVFTIRLPVRKVSRA
ncbi:MAG TPA: ATP-binding protein [Methylomirabilota bacterium]|jgi:signal transduction histidine kinase|nr:ATP-binding protein [Methylomirabilota bacterium]